VIRETSIEAYHKIKESGILSKRRWEVYDFVFLHGPTTIRRAVKHFSFLNGQEISITFSSYGTRFSELQRMGAIQEAGRVVDEDTGNTVMLWDVTNRIPVKFQPKESKDQKIKRLEEELIELKESLCDKCRNYRMNI
jgi:hypothetical protein